MFAFAVLMLVIYLCFFGIYEFYHFIFKYIKFIYWRYFDIRISSLVWEFKRMSVVVALVHPNHIVCPAQCIHNTIAMLLVLRKISQSFCQWCLLMENLNLIFPLGTGLYLFHGHIFPNLQLSLGTSPLRQRFYLFLSKTLMQVFSAHQTISTNMIGSWRCISSVQPFLGMIPKFRDLSLPK